jgi:Predicted nucleotide-binding protein containing TIR-like domain
MKIFVAHPFSPHPIPNYRYAFAGVEKAFKQRNIIIDFVFGDQALTGQHLLDKMQSLIQNCDIGIYDLSSWNPNVALEMGMALALNKPVRVLLCSQGERIGVPSDVQGVERFEYSDIETLERSLTQLINQEVADPNKPALEHLAGIYRAIKQAIMEQGSEDGLRAVEIVDATGLPLKVVQAVVTEMTSEYELFSTGAATGTRYHVTE